MAGFAKNAVKDLLQSFLLRGRFFWRLPGPYRDAVALTFDDGPDERFTTEVMSILGKKGAKATFFLLGKNIERHPGLAKALVKEGHMIASHGYSHEEVVNLDRSALKKELEAAGRLIENAGGAASSLFRPPRGRLSASALLNLLMAGRKTVLWTRTSSDYKKAGTKGVIDNIGADTVPGGSILLFHDNNEYTVEALPVIIDALKKRGMRFVTLEALEKA